MGIEIERKFLVKNSHWKSQVERTVEMAQGYINDLDSVNAGKQNASVRVRIEGDAAFLNMKSRQLGHTRQEFDYPIPVADARELLKLCVGGIIQKQRHIISQGHLCWEIDEFAGENSGLIVAEIELSDADEYFSQPDWLGEEVTSELRYYNLALASYPYSQWTAEEK